MKPIIASLALLICLTSTTLCSSDDVVTPAEAKVVLVAPQSCRIGELVRLDVSASAAASYKWLLVPESVDFLVYDSGERAVFSARTSGKYQFIIAVAYKDTVDVVTHTITVKTPPAQPATELLSDWIPYWIWNYPLPPDECMSLSESFAAIAKRDDLKTPQDWMKVTIAANKEILGDRTSAWAPILNKISAGMKKRAEMGELETVEQHAATWNEIAEGLRNCG